LPADILPLAITPLADTPPLPADVFYANAITPLAYATLAD